MAEKPREFKRLNRAVGVAEALAGTLDPVLKKRGFASRDLVTHWPSIAPAPYDTMSAPDRLVWPRGEKRAAGAILHLRCADAHKLALAHEGPRLAAAVNRYFGYGLVGEVRISVAPFAEAAQPRPARAEPSPAVDADVARAVGKIEDAGLRDALSRLGRAIIGKRRS